MDLGGKEYNNKTIVYVTFKDNMTMSMCYSFFMLCFLKIQCVFGVRFESHQSAYCCKSHLDGVRVVFIVVHLVSNSVGQRIFRMLNYLKENVSTKIKTPEVIRK